MARLLKPLKVGDWTSNRFYGGNPYGITIELFYDRNRHDHFASYAGEEVRDASLAEVKKKLEERLPDWISVTWQAIVEVKVSAPVTVEVRDRAQHAGRVSLEFSRYWIGRRQDGALRKLRWLWSADLDRRNVSVQVPGVEQLAQSESWRYYGDGDFAPPCTRRTRGYGSQLHGSGDETTHYLPHTPDLWLGLEALGEAIIAVRNQIGALLDSAAGRAHLAAIGAKQALVLPPHASHHDRSPYLPPKTPALPAPERDRGPATEQVSFSIDPALLPELLNLGLATAADGDEEAK